MFDVEASRSKTKMKMMLDIENFGSCYELKLKFNLEI